MADQSDIDSIDSFITDFGVGEFTHTFDESGENWSAFEITTQPAFVFINDDGTMTTHNGGLGADALEAQIAELQTS